ncbi:MAG: AraC family transcriptional regulator [Pseudomonadota bacterium]|jgi:AraC-like DNA-binding protein|uniref:AraC family transcriptional regulator n=1 Tax=Burkholderiaceae TaxID=119060 RepID=UPI0010F6A279|nr:AraC family transcriptional regulator [Burkholderia sp. 4M9327F10]
MANGVSLTKNEPTAPSFWRDDALPFIEARSIEDGRGVCYGKHAHATFSIGAVTGGESTYLNGRTVERIGAGAVVVINPEQVHACNPLDNRLWAYRMIYADAVWLGELQRDLGMHQGGDFHAFSTTLTTSPALYHGLNGLYAILSDADSDTLQRHSAVVDFFAQVHRILSRAPVLKTAENRRLARAADYIKDNCQRSLLLDEICAAADLSASYLIRAFKLRYGMTPHAYLMNSRVEYSRAQLRRGRAIAEVAAEAGFADQAHLQRTFRKFVAATPGQYRG